MAVGIINAPASKARSSTRSKLSGKLMSLSQRLSRPRARVAAAIEHDLAIDEHVFDSLVVLKRIGICRSVDDLRRIKQAQIGGQPFANQTSIAQAKFRGIQARHLANGVFQRQ